MLNARVEIGDDGVEIGQVELKVCEDFAQMKWSDDPSAVASATVIRTAVPELKLSRSDLTNHLLGSGASPHDGPRQNHLRCHGTALVRLFSWPDHEGWFYRAQIVQFDPRHGMLER